MIKPNTGHRHIAALDGVRAIAILVVMGYHAGVAPGGLFGVDIFLVLSGYLITSLLVAERVRSGAINVTRFYLRRVLRLMPAAVATLAVFIVAGYALLPHSQSKGLGFDGLSALGYFANFWEPISHMVYFGHFWSLSLEEQYYFIWPAVLLFVAQRYTSRRVALGLTGLCVVSYLTSVLWWHFGHAGPWIEDMLPTRGLGLFIGSALAMAIDAGLLPRSRRFLYAVAYLAIISVPLWLVIAVKWPYQTAIADRDAALFGYLLVDLTAAVVVLHITSGTISPLTRLLSTRCFVFLGALSYSLYLVHLPIFVLFEHTSLGLTERRVAMFVVALLVAYALHELVERPFLTLRNRLEAHLPQRQPAAPTPAGDERRLTATTR